MGAKLNSLSGVYHCCEQPSAALFSSDGETPPNMDRRAGSSVCATGGGVSMVNGDMFVMTEHQCSPWQRVRMTITTASPLPEGVTRIGCLLIFDWHDDDNWQAIEILRGVDYTDVFSYGCDENSTARNCMLRHLQNVGGSLSTVMEWFAFGSEAASWDFHLICRPDYVALITLGDGGSYGHSHILAGVTVTSPIVGFGQLGSTFDANAIVTSLTTTDLHCTCNPHLAVSGTLAQHFEGNAAPTRIFVDVPDGYLQRDVIPVLTCYPEETDTACRSGHLELVQRAADLYTLAYTAVCAETRDSCDSEGAPEYPARHLFYAVLGYEDGEGDEANLTFFIYQLTGSPDACYSGQIIAAFSGPMSDTPIGPIGVWSIELSPHPSIALAMNKIDWTAMTVTATNAG